MTHLTSEQLSAHLDGALSGQPAEEAERHLAECETCRDSLATLAAQDEALRPALTHDPGEDYFDQLPGRVAERIHERRAPQPGAGFDLSRFFGSPRSMAWVGAAAVVVVGAGIVLLTSREVGTPDLRDRDLMERSERGHDRPAAPSEGALETRPAVPPPATPAPTPAAREQERASANARKDRAAEVDRSHSETAFRGTAPAPTAARKPAGPAPTNLTASGQKKVAAAPPRPVAPAPKPSADDQRIVSGQRAGAAAPSKAQVGAERKPVATGRATEVKLNEAGEPVPTRSRPAPPVSQAAKEKVDQIRKQVAAEPLKDARTRDEGASLGAARKTEPVAKALARDAQPSAPPPTAALAPSSDAVAKREVRLCGAVRDDAGRPIPGAALEIAGQLGTSTDLQGSFCLDVPAGEHRMTVMAVGFTSSTVTIRTGSAERLRITLAPVGVLTKPLETARPAPSARPSAPPPVSSDPFALLPESQRAVVRAALQIEANADARRTAKLYDDAASAWQRALRVLSGQSSEIDARWHLAETRFRAWEAAPTQRRELAAIEALTSYVVRAPGGAQRERATHLLDRIKN